MEYFYVILPKLLSFFLLIGIGVLTVKYQIITSENLSLLSGLIVKLILPCLIFSLVWKNQTTFLSLWNFRRIILWQSITYFILILLGFFIIRICHLLSPTSNTLYGCIIGGNYGFIVIPLIMALFPDVSEQQYIPICAATDTLFVWTIGIHLFTRTKKQSSAKRCSLKHVLNPVFLSFLTAIIICSIHLPLPAPVISVIDQLGNTSCLGLIYLGSSLCFIHLKKLPSVKSLFLLILFRQILFPVMIHLITRPFLPDTERICIVLVTAAPSFSAASMIAHQYHLDEDFASSAVFLTTLASAVTIPFIFYLMAVI